MSTVNRLCGRFHPQDRHRLYVNCGRYKTILAAIDGTNYGYLALKEAFEMSNSGDLIVGYHIPFDSHHFAYEHSVFQSGVDLTLKQKEEYESRKKKFINEIDEKVAEIKMNAIKRDV